MRFGTENELNACVTSAERIWLFLDYDGTLDNFTRTPEIIHPNGKVIDLVKRLALPGKIRVAIVSGRSLRDLQTLLPLQGITLVGTYGIEIRTAEGELIQRADYAEIRPYIDSLKPQWEEIIAGYRDIYLEDKGWALALHARFARDAVARQIISSIQHTLDQDLITGTYRLIKRPKFVEISPATAHKGLAVSYLLNHYPLPGAGLVYIGDDDNDSEAFSTIQASGGVAIAVKQYFGYIRSTGGDYVLKSPKAVRRWLENLLQYFSPS